MVTIFIPLGEISEQNEDFVWSPGPEAAYNVIHAIAVNFLTVAIFDYYSFTFIYTDASDARLNTVLSLIQNGKKRK